MPFIGVATSSCEFWWALLSSDKCKWVPVNIIIWGSEVKICCLSKNILKSFEPHDFVLDILLQLRMPVVFIIVYPHLGVQLSLLGSSRLEKDTYIYTLEVWFKQSCLLSLYPDKKIREYMISILGPKALIIFQVIQAWV